MNKKEFMAALRAKLSRLPKREVEERLSFYSEIIDDKIEEGRTEQMAIAEIGSVDAVAAQILADIPMLAIVKEKIKPKGGVRAWETALIVIGFPVWLPLFVTFFALALTVYAVLWCVPLALWAVELPFFIMAYFSKGLFIGCKYTTTGVLWLSKKMAYGIKRILVGGENAK